MLDIYIALVHIWYTNAGILWLCAHHAEDQLNSYIDRMIKLIVQHFDLYNSYIKKST